MINRIEYLGPLVLDTGIAGERKRDGIVPAHAGILQASAGRWLLFFATLDSAGWDGTKSILYQLRAEGPDGPILKEGVIAPSVEDWDPLGRGDRLSKRCGMPVAFGVPKGARLDGKPHPNANIFAVKWYRLAFLRKEGGLVNPIMGAAGGVWPEGREVMLRTLRVEWMQFRLNDRDDDIEVIEPAQLLHQAGYDSAEEFCSLGPGHCMNEAMTPPLPMNPRADDWMEYATLSPAAWGQGQVAPIRYHMNPATRRYEWVQTGRLCKLEGRNLGETSAVRHGDDWFVAIRNFSQGRRPYWLRTSDPFGPSAKPVHGAGTNGPAEGPIHAYGCPDGSLRLLGNELEGWPAAAGPTRAALYLWDVDPESFALQNRRVVLDALRGDMVFVRPHVDHSKLCPHQGVRQLVIFRCIAARHTSHRDPRERISAEEHANAGIHCAEITYAAPAGDPWSLETGRTGACAGRP